MRNPRNFFYVDILSEMNFPTDFQQFSIGFPKNQRSIPRTTMTFFSILYGNYLQNRPARTRGVRRNKFRGFKVLAVLEGVQGRSSPDA